MQGTETDWFDIRTGVRKGCPLSPLLFNIYMDFLARQVIPECEEAGMRGFEVAYRINVSWSALKTYSCSSMQTTLSSWLLATRA